MSKILWDTVNEYNLWIHFFSIRTVQVYREKNINIIGLHIKADRLATGKFWNWQRLSLMSLNSILYSFLIFSKYFFPSSLCMTIMKISRSSNDNAAQNPQSPSLWGRKGTNKRITLICSTLSRIWVSFEPNGESTLTQWYNCFWWVFRHQKQPSAKKKSFSSSKITTSLSRCLHVSCLFW